MEVDREELVADEIMLPAQLATLRFGGVERMWIAVVEQAMRDRDAAWFSSPSEDVGSFRWVAIMLRQEPDTAQRRMMRLVRSGKRVTRWADTSRRTKVANAKDN